MKECVASMAGPLLKASLHAKRDACKISGRVVKNPWALVSCELQRFADLLRNTGITNNEAMKAERREFSRGAQIRFTRLPNASGNSPPKDGLDRVSRPINH
jgi:hypothetical protein